MRLVEIESWALDVIERVKAGQPNEDSRVELKREWIPAQKAARRIAGHANAARGDAILWLFGVDEDAGVTGVDQNELSSWFAELESEFDGLAPDMMVVNVPQDGMTVVALLFETDRAPYVVKNPVHGKPKGGPVSWEVPWRDGTRVRTAKRSDLLRLLVPILSVPEVEVLEGELQLAGTRGHFWRLEVNLYVVPVERDPVTIPFHRCEAAIVLGSKQERIILSEIRLTPRYVHASGARIFETEPDRSMAVHSQDDVTFLGPARVTFRAYARDAAVPALAENSCADFRLRLRPAHTQRAMTVTGTLVWTPDEDRDCLGLWTLQ